MALSAVTLSLSPSLPSKHLGAFEGKSQLLNKGNKSSYNYSSNNNASKGFSPLIIGCIKQPRDPSPGFLKRIYHTIAGWVVPSTAVPPSKDVNVNDFPTNFKFGAGSSAIQTSVKKLMRDFKRLQRDPPAGISGAPQEDNIMLWNAVIFGPDGTPWDGGKFKLTLQFSEDYPNKPPTVQFVSRMFHPNIYEDGRIDILQNQWSPDDDVAAILMAIQWQLCDPDTNSPANLVAARMFRENRCDYNRIVREVVEQSWTAD